MAAKTKTENNRKAAADAAAPEGGIVVGKSTKYEVLDLKFGNRHGLVTGATGTGKTVTLQILAEGFCESRRAGIRRRHQGRSVGDQRGRRSQGSFRQARGSHGAALPARPVLDNFLGCVRRRRAIPSAQRFRKWGRCCCRASCSSTILRKAFSTSPFVSPTTKDWLLVDLKDLRAMLNMVAENAAELAQHNTGMSRPRPSARSSGNFWSWKIRAPPRFSESRRSTSMTSCVSTAMAAAWSIFWRPTS